MRSAAATGGSASEVMLDFDAIDALEAIFIFAVIAGVTWHDGRSTGKFHDAPNIIAQYATMLNI